MPRAFVRERVHFERPVTPLFATTLLPAIEHGYRAAADGATLEMRVEGGYVYTAWAPAPPGTAPSASPRMLGELAEVWTLERIPEVRALLGDLRRAAASSASARRAAAELERGQGALERMMAIHYEATLTTASGVETLEGALARLGDPAPALTCATLLSGVPSLLQDVESWLAEHAGKGAAALAASPFFDEVRDRPAWLDLAAPTWGDAPVRAARAAAGADARALAERRARARQARDEAEAAALARFPPEVRDGVRAGLGMLRAAQGAAQSLNFLTGELAVGATRGAYLRGGDLLVKELALDAREDVLFLEREEVLRALRGEVAGLRVLAAARRAAFAEAEARAPPETLGDPEAAAALLADPKVAAMLGARAAEPPMESAAGTRRLQGIGGSPGVAEGRARVVLHEDDLASLQKGEVLVVPSLLPAWTSAMQRAAAIVSDAGGILSHAAVVAREMGVPAAVGVGGATRRIRTGDVVRVDGGTGDVDVLRSPA